MTLAVNDGTNSPQVTTSSNHTQIAGIELDEIHDLIRGDIQLDGIVDFHQWIRVANSTSVMGSDERNTLWSNLDTANFAEFVLYGGRVILRLCSRALHSNKYLCFLSGDSVDGKTSFNIIN